MTKKHIKQVVAFIVLFLVFSFVIDKLVYFTLNRTSDKVRSGYMIGKLNHYLELKDTTEILVFGNSRTNHHIDVSKFSRSAFNMGLDGVRLAYIAPLIKLLPENKEQIVVLHLDGYEADYQGECIMQLMVKYHRIDSIRSEIDRLGKSNPLQKFFWSLDYNGTVLSILINRFRPGYDYMEYSGFDPEQISPDQQESVLKLLHMDTDSIPCDEVQELNELAKRYVREIHSFCTHNQKKLIVITSPMYILDCKEEHFAMVDFLLKEGIEYYDFTDFFQNNNSDYSWRDRTHLLEPAAEIFTDHLMETVSLLK